MNIFKKWFFQSIIIIIIISCSFEKKTQFDSLSIYNATSSAVYLYITSSDTLPLTPKLNLFDTVFLHSTQNRDTILSPIYRINAYSYYTKNDLTVPNVNIEELCLKSKDLKIKLYFIKESTMRIHNWTEIYLCQLYEKKIVLSESDIQRLNWEIEYK